MSAYRVAVAAISLLAGLEAVAAAGQAPAPALARIHRPSLPPPSILPVAQPGANDPPAQVTVAVDGRSILISGTMMNGSASRLAVALAAAPQARVVVLQSPGGQLGEAARIASLIRGRHLDTYVETFCASACTIALMAGRDRAIAPNAVIGFHRPVNFDFSELSKEDVALTRVFYAQAGYSSAFIDRMYEVPNEELWQPSFAELRAENVVTRRTLGGETAANMSRYATREALRQVMLDVPFWRSLSARHPAIAESAFSAMWTAKESGASDGDVMQAGRVVLMSQMPIILAGASDQHLEQYLTVVLDQLVAARALGPEACVRMTNGQLDAGASLPPYLVDRELALLDRIVSQSGPAAMPDREAGERLLREVLAAMPAAQAETYYHPEQPASDYLRCEASIALIRGVNELQPEARRTLARFLFASPREE